MRKSKQYKIIGAYDSETTNLISDGKKTAFPILHQLGLLSCAVQDVTNDNVERVTDIELYRHSLDLYERLDDIATQDFDYVPVICCHNLAFDMYGLAPYLNDRNVKVLAKSNRKPITFTVLDADGNPRLVIWDTLVFAQKSLAYMGDECGYAKLSGAWDYDLIRTPHTPLTDDEIAYAKHDVYALLAWLGYWCRLNPDIDSSLLARRVVTKTGVVRIRRTQRFEKLRGVNLKKSLGNYWYLNNHRNMFHDDEELFTCTASTRGGLTFCSSVNASRVFDFTDDDTHTVLGFDATSQHPSQIVSHYYPVEFKKASTHTLENIFRTVQCRSIDYMLGHYSKPFPSACYAAFEFTNLRMKSNTIFSRCGIPTLASARCREFKFDATVEDNQDREEYKEYISQLGYKDFAENPVYEFGKLVSADRALLFLTELAIWEVCQVYKWDSVRAVTGYATLRYMRPADMTTVSVMQFYDAKNEFKRARGRYYDNLPIDNAERLRELGVPAFVVEGMQDGTIDEQLIESTYLGLKADLNALFGIECSNEYRRDNVLTDTGIEYAGEFGICNAPKHPKAWYQCGQRIVGWSRIAQMLVMMLLDPYIETIINGDTDSIKVVARKTNIPKIHEQLSKYATAIDRAKEITCRRVQREYPDYFSTLDEIGYYVSEFAVDRYCASWNKAYCICETNKRTGEDEIKFTLAGIPSKRGVNQLATKLLKEGRTFAEICDSFLGYNVTYAHDLILLNARKFPEWGNIAVLRNVTDYTGATSSVMEPEALCLYPMAKTVNDTGNAENRANMLIAVKNRPSVNVEPVIIYRGGVLKTGDLIG